MNAVTSLAWVRRGVAKLKPDKLRLDDEELGQLIANSSEDDDNENDDEEDDDDEDNDDLSEDDNEKDDNEKDDDENDDDDVKDDDDDDDDDDDEEDGKSKANKSTKSKKLKSLKRSNQKASTGDRVVDTYGLDDYDDDDGGEAERRIQKSAGMTGLSTYSKNADDPYLKGSDSESDSDLVLEPDDNLLIASRTAGDHHSLEVWVFNEQDNLNLYCHHDYILPEFPLCVEWVGVDVGDGSAGNFAAVGSTASNIDIWDLDVVNTLEPAFTLPGGEAPPKKKKKKSSNNESDSSSMTGHTDAVLALSWNRMTQTCLASGSADHRVALWDLSEGRVAEMLELHKDKVQCLCWHPVESTVLLSGSYDKTVRMFDVTSSKAEGFTWKIDGEVERVTWNPHNPNYILACSSTGHVVVIDVRLGTKGVVLDFEAHSSAVTGVAMSPTLAGCVVTSSEDQTVKLWNVGSTMGAAEKITSKGSLDTWTLVSEKRCKIGSVFCVSVCPEAELIFSVAGENEMKVLNFGTDAKVQTHFGLTPSEAKKSTTKTKNSKKKLIKNSDSM